MPEGDTLHKIAGVMRPRALGEPVAGLWLRDRGWVEGARGLCVDDVAAVGKHLLVSIGPPDRGADRGGPRDGALRLVAHVHLGMRGRVHGYDPAESPPRLSEPVLRLELEKRAWLFRRTAVAEIVRSIDLAAHPALSRLGPDLLDRRVDLDAIVARARKREPRTVADLLLDQTVACGIGNVYKSEVLFVEGVDPWSPVVQLSDAMLRRLYGRASQLLRQNLGGWRRTTVRRVDASHLPRRGETRHWVYGRVGLPCLRCARAVRVSRQGDQSRVTYWCATCQH